MTVRLRKPRNKGAGMGPARKSQITVGSRSELMDPDAKRSGFLLGPGRQTWTSGVKVLCYG